jgi:putative zinc finger/helix-turn-helix YgiT family protein
MATASDFRTRRRCPACGEADLKVRFVSEKYEYDTDRGGVIVETTDVPIEYCDACGETFAGPQAARIRHDALVKALGFLRPEEIRGLRERLGKSPEEFAQLVGSTAEDVSLWERGRRIQDRSIDRFLRVLAGVPEVVRFLENGAGNPGPRAEVTATKADGGQTEEVPDRPRRPVVPRERGPIKQATKLRERAGPNPSDE